MSGSIGRKVRILCLSSLAAVATAGCTWHEETATGPVTIPLDNPLPVAKPAPEIVRHAPAELQARIDRLGSNFSGSVGIAVRDVSDSWSARFNSGIAAPQQSVSKLWVAIALFDAIDRGRIRLDESVTVGPQDLTVFHQPIRYLIGDRGYRTNLETLLRYALVRSDNTANDMLLRRVGGPETIRTMLALKQIDQVRFGPGEKLLQASIAGLDWQPRYSVGSAFQDARARLPRPLREAALARYLAEPLDAATPDGISRALVRLKRGELLSPSSTSQLLDIMASSQTGRARLRAGLSPGWTLAHKTGTGQELGGRATGFNDVGVLTSPSGHSYAIAVMIADTRAPIGQRQQLMSDVTRAVIAHEESLDRPAQTASADVHKG